MVRWEILAKVTVDKNQRESYKGRHKVLILAGKRSSSRGKGAALGDDHQGDISNCRSSELYRLQVSKGSKLSRSYQYLPICFQIFRTSGLIFSIGDLTRNRIATDIIVNNHMRHEISQFTP